MFISDLRYVPRTCLRDWRMHFGTLIRGLGLSMIGLLALSRAADCQERLGEAPRERVHLYILIGQSNMVGRAPVEDVDRQPHPRVFSFGKDDVWVPAVDPLHFDKPTAGVGLGSSFARAMAEADPEVTIGLIPCAIGGTPLERWEKGGDLWSRALERIRAVADDGVIKGVLWHQGEADGRSAETAQSYGVRLARMVSDLRAELQLPILPFVAGQLGPFLPATQRDGNPAHWEVVKPQLAGLPRCVEWTAVADSADLTHTGDSVHFDAASLRKFGRRYAREMQRLQSRQQHPAFAAFEARADLPNVLLIGDSISMQYTPEIRRRLEGRANVHRPLENCRSTRQILERLEAYLGDRNWDIIVFNAGIHDLTLVDKDGRGAPAPEGAIQVPIEQYAGNLEQIVVRLKRTGAKLIWISTTPVGARAEAAGIRSNQRVTEYNAAAARLTSANQIQQIDAYTTLSERREELLEDGVHLTDQGVIVISDAIVSGLEPILAAASR